MLITAGLFALASLPTFLVLQERSKAQAGIIPGHPWRESFSRLGQTLHHARRYRDLWRFLVCLVLYQAGVQTVIALAAVYAQQAMGFDTRQTLTLIMVVNLTAAAGAVGFGQVQDRIGHVATIALTLAGWMLVVILAWSATGPGMFWAAANLAGLCLGSSQSAGRALVGYLSPATRRAEFFGLWGLAVKLSSILGPITYGIVTWISGGDHRLAMIITGGYFVMGMAVLRGVNVQRGRRAALTARTQDVT
jgi:UMF1 family MFS transporter